MPSLVDENAYPKPFDALGIETLDDVRGLQDTIISQFRKLALYDQYQKETALDILESGDIAALTVGSLLAGTITTDQIYLKSTQFELDGILGQIRVKDANGTLRVNLGIFGAGTDAGARFYASDGTLLVQFGATTYINGVVIQNGTITAPQLNVSTLSAITANMGSLTSGTITGALIRTGAGNPRIQLDTLNLVGINASGTTVFDLSTSGTVRIGPASGNNIYWNGSAFVITGALIAGSNLQGGSVDTFQIVDGAVVATKISVTQLSAITADMGSLTAGTITGATTQTSAANPKVILNSTGISAINAAGTTVFNASTAGTVRLGPSTGNNMYWNGSTLTITGQIIVSGNMTANSVTTPAIAASNVVANSLATNSVVTDKINNASVNHNKRINVYEQTSAITFSSIPAGEMASTTRSFTHSLGVKPVVVLSASPSLFTQESIFMWVQNITTSSFSVVIKWFNNTGSANDPGDFTLTANYW